MKITFLTSVLCVIFINSQAQNNGWQNLDLIKDGVFGISTERAYLRLLKGKPSKPVTVAIIDSGVDTTHEDLKSVIWKNLGEIVDNDRDDDNNGYIDDIYGWNFTGLPVSRDSIVSWISHKEALYDSLSYTRIPENIQKEYSRFRTMTLLYRDFCDKLETMLANIDHNKAIIRKLVKATGKENPKTLDFKKLQGNQKLNQTVLQQLINLLPLYKDYNDFDKQAVQDIRDKLAYVLSHTTSVIDSAGTAASLLNTSADISYDHLFTIPNANEFLDNQPLTFHGTHIAGIIAANRTNGKGMMGIADNVKIMNLKIYSGLFPVFTDERLSKAIRYAVDNGARIINLSLAVGESHGKSQVDEAVRYAMDHNVLIVRAAGNSGKDMDHETNEQVYPNKYYAGRAGIAPAWLTVGASGWKDDSTLVAPFSNYGKTQVDVFAPGIKIYSTIPGSRYQAFNGTSMAAPVVVGLAALIMEYHPTLTAVQVREIIMRSVVKVNHMVRVPGQHDGDLKLLMSDLCVSGGIVNAYNALKLAETYK